MAIQLMQANVNVQADAGKAAIQRGPLIYCLEEEDNGKHLSSLSVNVDSEWIENEENFPAFGKVITIEASGYKDSTNTAQLYSVLEKKQVETKFKAIPYFVWGNRNIGEMRIWIRY